MSEPDRGKLKLKPITLNLLIQLERMYKDYKATTKHPISFSLYRDAKILDGIIFERTNAEMENLMGESK